MNQYTKTALIIGGVLATIFIVLPLFAWVLPGQQGIGSGMMGGWGWGLFMPVFGILFWVLVIWGVVALVRGVGQPGSSDSPSSRLDSALDILKRRYARGEISKEEYQEKKRDLV